MRGAPTVLRYADVPDFTAHGRDVLIRVQAISIEGGDILNRRMVAPVNAPQIVSYQAAGVIQAVGLEVSPRSPTRSWIGWSTASS